MSDISLIISHPATAIYVPKGARKPACAFVRRETEATLRKARPGDFEPLGPCSDLLKGSERLHRGLGGLWEPLQAWGKGLNPNYLKPAEFVAWLRDPEASTGLHLGMDLGGTPLLAAWTDRFNPWGKDFVRGHRSGRSRGDDPAAVDGAREVKFDGTDAARARVARFLEEDFRLTPHRVYRRVRPLVSCQTIRNAYDPSAITCGFEMQAHGMLTTKYGVPVCPDLAKVAAERWTMPGSLKPGLLKLVADRFEGHASHEADLDALANGLPGFVLDMLWLDRGKAGSADLWERAREKAEGLRVEAMEGLVGGNAGAEREPLFRRIVEGLRAVTDAFEDDHRARYLRSCLLYVEEVAMPRIRRGAEASQEDVESLGALAP